MIGFLTKELLPLTTSQVPAGTLLGFLDETVQIDVPHPHRTVATACDEPTVPCEGQGPDRPLMPREDAGLVGGMLQVPQPYRAIFASRD
jgi:hypothetical protein